MEQKEALFLDALKQNDLKKLSQLVADVSFKNKNYFDYVMTYALSATYFDALNLILMKANHNDLDKSVLSKALIRIVRCDACNTAELLFKAGADVNYVNQDIQSIDAKYYGSRYKSYYKNNPSNYIYR